MEYFGFKDWPWLGPSKLIGFISIIVIGILSIIAQWYQKDKIKQTAAADLLPFPAYIGQFGLYATTALYGWYLGLAALVIVSPPRIIITALIIKEMLKYRKFSKIDWFFAILTVVLLALSFNEHRVAPMSVLMAIYTLAYFLIIPVGMWKSNSRGSVSLRATIFIILGQAVWLIYGIIVYDWFIIGCATILCILPFGVLFVWYRVPREPMFISIFADEA